MRIALDLRLAFHREGGIAEYGRQLAASLAPRLRDDALVVLHSARDRKAALVPESPLVRRRGLWTPAHHRWEHALLGCELQWLKADLLHSPDFITPRHWRRRAVITIHDLAFLRFPETITRESLRYYGQVAESARRSDHIIAVSEHTKQDILALLHVPADKVSVVYEGVDPLFRPLQDATLVKTWCAARGLTPGYFLFVGTLEPRKNLPMLLKAFSRLNGRLQDAHLVVAGGRGWLDEDIVEAVRQLRLGERVHLLGRVSKEDLLMLYHGATAFTLPSLYEGFGLPLLEAMACGTPVIAANVSSIPEVVGTAGLLIDPHDEEAWATSLELLLSDGAVREILGRAGLARAARFSWAQAAEQTLQIYRAVVKGT